MKRFSTISLLMFLVFMFIMECANAEHMYVLCRPNDYVNARAFPTTNGELVGRFDCGDYIETDGETKKDKQGRVWIKVCGLEGEAWICSMYLQESVVEVVKCTGYISACGRVAVRRSPNGKRVKWLVGGDEVTILAMSDEWALTTIGYIKREYLDVVYW